MADDKQQPRKEPEIPPWFADAEEANFALLPKKAGAKTKLTPHLKARVCRLIAMGVPVDVSVAACGISKSVYYKWMALGNSNRAGIYHEFVEDIHRSTAISHSRMSLFIGQAASKGDWRAAAFHLERRHSKHWNRRDTIPIDDGEPGALVAAHRETIVAIVETPETREAVRLLAAAMVPVRDREKEIVDGEVFD